MPLLKPKKVVIHDIDKKEHKFTLHRLPAILGREIAYQYLPSNMPKVGDYAKSQELCFKMLEHVTVDIGGNDTPLDSQDLIDNHCIDWQVLSRLEDAMLDYNTDFLAGGKGSIFSQISERALMLCLTPMSTVLSDQSSSQTKQP